MNGDRFSFVIRPRSNTRLSGHVELDEWRVSSDNRYDLRARYRLGRNGHAMTAGALEPLHHDSLGGRFSKRRAAWTHRDPKL